MQATVLIVEDHDILRETLRAWLMEIYPRCRVLEATSGKEAIAIARNHSPQVIILDSNLPGMNSFEATARIKALAPTAQVAILTLYNYQVIHAAALAAGASACISKNAIVTELESRLTQWLS